MARNDANKRSRAHLESVALNGIGSRPLCEVSSAMQRKYPFLRHGRLKLSKLGSSGQVKLSHEEAKQLLTMEHDPLLFGADQDFTVVPYVPLDHRLYMSWIPRHVNNRMLLRCVPGAYKVRRFPTMPSKGIIYLNSEYNQALLLRDGIMIGNTPITFDAVLRRKCQSCNRLEHGLCEKISCFTCGYEGHKREECKDEPSCLWCHDESHLLSNCKEYQEERLSTQRAERNYLLQSLQSNMNVDDDSPRTQQKLSFTVKQKSIMKRHKIDDDFSSHTSYAAIVKRKTSKNLKRNRRKKDRASKPRQSVKTKNTNDVTIANANQNELILKVVQNIVPAIVKAVQEAFVAALSPVIPREEIETLRSIDVSKIGDNVVKSIVYTENKSEEAKLDENNLMDIQLNSKRSNVQLLSSTDCDINFTVDSGGDTPNPTAKRRKPSAETSVHKSSHATEAGRST